MKESRSGFHNDYLLFIKFVYNIIKCVITNTSGYFLVLYLQNGAIFLDKWKKHPEKKIKNVPVSAMVEDIVGCKWSLTTLDLIQKGINRPGAMVREVDGLSTKVLNERLSKMVRYGILEKISYPEIPPRVEYRFTDFGNRFCLILDDVRNLQEYLNSQITGIDRA